ncbi:hypothetical protein ACF0H5_013598 [Mactra antiquata]
MVILFIICCLFAGVQSLLNITVAGKQNGDITLQCRIPEPVPNGIIVRWYSAKDSWLTSGTRVYKHRNHMSVQKPAPNEWNLHIKNLAQSFADVYTCHTDTNVTVSIISLVIESEPKFEDGLTTGKYYTVTEGGYAVMKCVVSGKPEPIIEWFRGNESYPLKVYGSQLKIPGVQRYAADLYICKAKNKYGADKRSINMTVAFEPEVDVMSPVVYAKQGEAAVLSCVVQGSPLVDVYWTDNDDKRISTSWKYLINEVPAGNGIPVKFINLIFRPAIITIHNYGKYTCNAKSYESHVQKAVELKRPEDKPADGTFTYN